MSSQLPFTAEEAMRLRSWLGVTGSYVTRYSWGRMDENTRKLYVASIVSVCEQAEMLPAFCTTFQLGDKVRKIRGSQWKGRVVGWYSTQLTKEGYAVESDTELGSVQIYPASALERVE